MARVQIGRIRNSCQNLVAIGLLPGNSVFCFSLFTCFVVPPCTVHTSSHHKYPIFSSTEEAHLQEIKEKSLSPTVWILGVDLFRRAKIAWQCNKINVLNSMTRTLDHYGKNLL